MMPFGPLPTTGSQGDPQGGAATNGTSSPTGVESGIRSGPQRISWAHWSCRWSKSGIPLGA